MYLSKFQQSLLSAGVKSCSNRYFSHKTFIIVSVRTRGNNVPPLPLEGVMATSQTSCTKCDPTSKTQIFTKRLQRLVFRSSPQTCDSHTLTQRDKDTIDGEEQKYLLTSNQQWTHLSITLDVGRLNPFLPVGLRRETSLLVEGGEGGEGAEERRNAYLQQNNQESLEVTRCVTRNVLLQVVVVL